MLISNCYSNVIRTEGESTKAMMGTLIGNLINVILDPIFILGFGWDIAGAAIATVIGNVIGAGYYIIYFIRGNSLLSVRLKDFTVKDKVASSVLAIGIPAALGSLLMSISSIVTNSQMVQYGDMALAGIGVAMKVTMMTGMVCIGLGQGIQPILGYCVGAKLWVRFKNVLHFSLAFSFTLSVVLTGVCYLFTSQIIRAFLIDATAYGYALTFSRILLSTSIFFGVFYVLINALQAMGAGTAALIINISRQGIIYIPVMFLLKTIIGMTGLVWAQPVADITSLALAYVLYVQESNKIFSKQ